MGNSTFCKCVTNDDNLAKDFFTSPKNKTGLNNNKVNEETYISQNLENRIFRWFCLSRPSLRQYKTWKRKTSIDRRNLL